MLDEPLADELTRGQALRFGALLHDIGKPATHDVREDGRVTFMGHDRLGQEMVRDICRRLRMSERLCRFLEAVTRHHLVLGFLVHERPLDRRAVYRYLERTSPVEVEVTLLSVADRLATRGKNAERAIDAHLELAEELMPAALEWRRNGPPPVPVRGDELAEELGIEPGPELGRLLAELAEAAYAGEASDRGAGDRSRPDPPPQSRAMIVDCAIYEEGKRRDGHVDLTHAYDERHRAREVRLDRAVRADRGGVRLAAERVQPSPARCGGRDPRAPAARSSRSTTTCCSSS